MPSRSKVMSLFNFVLLVIAVIQYSLLTTFNSPAEKYISTVLGFENSIKLIPGFIIPYFSVYILFFMILYLIIREKNSSDMSIFLTSVILLWSVINLGHGFFHTQYLLRPEIKLTGFFPDAVKNLYTRISIYNTFPNWHAATAVLCATVFYKMNFRRPVIIIAWCALICLSPVFLKLSHVLDVIIAIPLGILSYILAEKFSHEIIKRETIEEVTKVFTLESLIQSIAIGIRDENTIDSLIDGLTRIEKNLTETDKEKIKSAGSELQPPIESLKGVINNLILTTNVEKQIKKAVELYARGKKDYNPTDKELKNAYKILVNEASVPFDNEEFRTLIIEIKKKNTLLIDASSIEEAAKERSHNVIFRFKSFLDSYKTIIPVLNTIENNSNGHLKFTRNDVKTITRELRKPPYEITPDEIWKAYQRVDGDIVKPLADLKNAANIIPLTQYALGKVEVLEPYSNKVDKKFKQWIEENSSKGRKFSSEELDWLTMMKNYFASFQEINVTNFNQPPFEEKGGAVKAFTLFGNDLNNIVYELNEKLI